MQLYRCQSCGHRVYFENVVCTRCGHRLGFLPDRLQISALEPVGRNVFTALAATDGTRYRLCANTTDFGVCNWMVPETDDDALCASCRLNRTIPNLSVAGNKDLWQALESQKRRLVYSLIRLGLPVRPKYRDPAGLAFDFLADSEPSFRETGSVMTGHADGLITINVAEADPVMRERMRRDMAEPYRTILGHFRHESGHYYWDRLVRDTRWLDEVRGLFGDETLDYAQALETHHTRGPVADWQQRHVSAYASSHPWEDWAETWAHYLHIVDTLDTARHSGVTVGTGLDETGSPQAAPAFDAYAPGDFAPILEHWLPLAFALNNLNRSMGHADAYPFVLAPLAIEKLKLVHRIVQDPLTVMASGHPAT
ncbi:zinc-binding metallopeptidase family protein [Thioalkalivibrio paradoxus]|uniref:Zinc-ribbon domain-containing protein n=1 Tax=Thioalkalivibrio paradoxus ARh 1 TaxID=713585 RepID=W0DJG8_9GAMM|nr:putative zinc-binding peptidase [Thioalkalivibrio paradoxus]AHE98734.1 hypothetical protein THITH_11305 [Thioalkalivibrio paradoxus ARh 1]